MKKIFLKSSLCLALSSIFLTSSITPIFATIKEDNTTQEIINNLDDKNINAILDDDNKRIIEEILDNFKYVHTFQKKENIIKTEIYDLNNKKIDENIININEFTINDNIDQESKFFSPHYQKTFSNYEYKRKGYTDEYELRNKDYYKIKSLNNDKNAIEKYIDAVDTLNSAEIAIILSGGSTIIATIITLLDSGLTVGQVAAATGVLAGDIILYNSSVSKCKSVWNLYID